MARSLATEKAAHQRPELPPPPFPLTAEETDYYAEVMSTLPVQHHRSSVVRTLVTGIAQAMAETRMASELIEREGLVISAPQGSKAHPAVNVRDAAAKRIAALSSRLKALPSGDAREQQRQAAFETKARGSTPLTVVGSQPIAPAGTTPDWAALAKSTLTKEDQE